MGSNVLGGPSAGAGGSGARFFYAPRIRSIVACRIGGTRAAVRAELSQGTPVDLKDCFGRCALHYVKKSGALLDLLREHGAQLDDRADEGDTLLMLTAQQRNGPLVASLLELGADPRAIDHRGFSALHRASEMGEVACCE